MSRTDTVLITLCIMHLCGLLLHPQTLPLLRGFFFYIITPDVSH